MTAAVWAVLVRVPLLINAPGHLDSDLAVDGLTLLDAMQGHWRWHYPGTPHIGIGPLFLSLPQALAFGVNPVSLVSGGVVAYVLLMLATFLLAWRGYGPAVAAWSLVPLTFASNGAVWLSGRLTGGHLVDAVWHAGAFGLLGRALACGGWKSALGLGVWCGLGLYLDALFAVTLAGIVVAAVGSWIFTGASGRGLWKASAFSVGLLFGLLPRPVGVWVDPYDAYREQFAVMTQPDVLFGHARLLAFDCLPRLFSGHRLPGLETDPDPSSLVAPSAYRRPVPFDPAAAVVVSVCAAMLGASVWGLLRAGVAGPSTVGRAIASGLMVSSLATLMGFVVNRNIFNSDNYRYLVTLLVPGSVGFGLAIERFLREGLARTFAATLGLILLGALMTWDLARWYAQLGWLDDRARPVRNAAADPALDWLNANRDVTWIEGGYWDVYRLAFLTGGRVRGVPFPIYPNRFPGWKPEPGERRVTVLRPTPEGSAFLTRALRAGGKRVGESRGVQFIAAP